MVVVPAEAPMTSLLAEEVSSCVSAAWNWLMFRISPPVQTNWLPLATVA